MNTHFQFLSSHAQPIFPPTNTRGEKETLNCEEAAAFLKIHKNTLCILVYRGKLPGIKVGKRWVFLKEDLITFIRSKYQFQSPNQLSTKDLSCQSTKEKIPQTFGSKLRLGNPPFVNDTSK